MKKAILMMIFMLAAIIGYSQDNCGYSSRHSKTKIVLNAGSNLSQMDLELGVAFAIPSRTSFILGLQLASPIENRENDYIASSGYVLFPLFTQNIMIGPMVTVKVSNDFDLLIGARVDIFLLKRVALYSSFMYNQSSEKIEPSLGLAIIVN